MDVSVAPFSPDCLSSGCSLDVHHTHTPSNLSPPALHSHANRPKIPTTHSRNTTIKDNHDLAPAILSPLKTPFLLHTLIPLNLPTESLFGSSSRLSCFISICIRTVKTAPNSSGRMHMHMQTRSTLQVGEILLMHARLRILCLNDMGCLSVSLVSPRPPIPYSLSLSLSLSFSCSTLAQFTSSSSLNTHAQTDSPYYTSFWKKALIKPT
ncbi:hypothetical protein J3F83DRAFT_749772 [Trichoderma novae-zelandiae]